MKNSIVKDAIILFLITLLSGLALGVVHELTLEPIAAAQQAAANKTYQEVFPDAVTFETTEELAGKVEEANLDAANWGYGAVTIDECLEAKNDAGEVLGYVINATSPDGYAGDLQISVGVSNDKQVLGLGFLSISETPGLGLKANEPAFKDQFVGKDASGDIERIKTGTANEQQFNALSGATYTSTAVGNALNAAIRFFNNISEG